MAYKPPGTYARFVKTVSSVVDAGGSRIMGLVGTGINYYTVSNEAITKSNSKPYDELKNNNVFEITSISSRPIYNNLLTSDNIVYKKSSDFNKGYNVDGTNGIIKWDSLVPATCTIDATAFPEFFQYSNNGMVISNILYGVDESSTIPTEDGEWMIEVSYINEDDNSLKAGQKLGCYRVINNATGEIVGEYTVSDEAAVNPDGSYPIPGVQLIVKNTYITINGNQKVFVGDYVKITTTAAKTEREATVIKKLITTENNKVNLDAHINKESGVTKENNLITDVVVNWEPNNIPSVTGYDVYCQLRKFDIKADDTFDTSTAIKLISNTTSDSYEMDKETIINKMFNPHDSFEFEVTTESALDKNSDGELLETSHDVINVVCKNYDRNYTFEFAYSKTGTEPTEYQKYSATTLINLENNTHITKGAKLYVKAYELDSSNNVNVYLGNYLLKTLNDDSTDDNILIADLDETTINGYDENTNLYFIVNAIDSNGNIVDFDDICTEKDSSGEYISLTNDETSDINSNASSTASDKILYNAIGNLVITNNDTVYDKTAIYTLELTDVTKIKVTRYINGHIDTDFNDKYLTIGESDYFEDIPGVNFTIDSTLISSASVDDSPKIYIITSPRVVSNEIPAEGSSYYVSYKYRKSELDYEPKLFTNYDDIVNTYGNYDVSASSAISNSLSLGAEIAFNNGVSQIVCVQAKNNSSAEIEAAIDKLSKAIAGANNTCTVVPLTTDDSVGAYLKNHVNLMSSYEHGKERMGYLAGKINQPINKLATKSDRSVGLIDTANGYDDERIVYVVPGAINKSIRDLRTGKYNERTLPGCYAAVAVAAIGLANDPAEPLTNKTIVGFTSLPDLYSESEKNALASAGCCVLEHSGNNIRIRHGITTNNNEVNSQEITLIQIKDYVIDACRTTTADTYIGRKLTASIVADVKYTMNSMLNKFVSQGIIIGFSSLKVSRNSDEPRQIDVSFEIEAVYPLNWISIEFGFSSIS